MRQPGRVHTRTARDHEHEAYSRRYRTKRLHSLPWYATRTNCSGGVHCLQDNTPNIGTAPLSIGWAFRPGQDHAYDDIMTYARFLGAVLAALALSTVVIPSSLHAQEQEQTQEQELPQAVQAQLRVYANVYLAMVTARDDFQREMGHSHDEQERDRLRQGLRERQAEILVENELTAEEYEHITLQVSIDAQHRELFDQILEELSGNGAGT
jgi:hypothetical protein